MNTNIIKHILIGILTFLLLSHVGYAQLDSVNAQRLDALTTQVDNNQGALLDSLHNRVKGLNSRLVSLEKTSKQGKFLIWMLAIVATLLGGFTAWNYLVGIKNKSNEMVKRAISEQLPASTKQILGEALDNHPVIREHQRIQTLKAKTILIVSKEGKNANFNDFLRNKGFKHLKNVKLEALFQDGFALDADSYDLVLINNEHGDMDQKTMEQILDKLGQNEHYLYFNVTDQRWAGKKLAGFSNSRERLESNLIDGLDQ